MFAFSMREFMLASDTLVWEECTPFHEVMKMYRGKEAVAQIENMGRPSISGVACREAVSRKAPAVAAVGFAISGWKLRGLCQYCRRMYGGLRPQDDSATVD